MSRSVRIHEFGDARVLRIESVETGVPAYLTVRGLALPAPTRNDATLAALKRFVATGLAGGALHPTIARAFPFDRIADALRFMEAGEHVGKIVVTV